MADPKKDAPKKETHLAIQFFPLVVIGIIIIIGAWMNGETIFGGKSSEPRGEFFYEGKDPFSIYSLIGNGEMVEGSRIINTKDTIVRNEPAGGILGNQKKLRTGILKVGPVSAFNTDWWRVDYEDAPDGWVDAKFVTSKIATIRTINILPILYGIYKPFGYVFLIILLSLFIYFKLKLNKEKLIAIKKKQLRDEQYQEKPVPLSVKIDQKPDVEEIPGFQTEEIVPIEILEQQNRWIHIQELIKSYNSNDWRQAIIEADIILEEMLDKMGYDGVTIGDKLKNIERSDFITLDKAWSAHKVRNQIAHDGSNFVLTREIAEKTVKDFEDVFREFYYI